MKRTKLIEEYLDGTLPDHDKLALASKIEEDKELANLIRLHAEVNESIRDNDLYLLRLLLIDVSKTYFAEGRTFKKKFPLMVQRSLEEGLWKSHFLKYVAATFLLITTGFLIKNLLFSSLSSEVIYETHYQPYKEDIIIRSGDPIESKLILAIHLYQDGKYIPAYMAFEDISSDFGNYNLILFYLGLTSLGLQDYDNAVLFLNNISDSWEDPHSVHRDWYLALALLRKGEITKAIRIFNKLNSSDNYYSKSASSIMKRIRN